MARPQRRPLLVVTGQAMGTRRFLRGLVRLAPSYVQHFVVATGGAIRSIPSIAIGRFVGRLEILPFPLVFFCHNDPVDAEAGFRFHSDSADPDEIGTSSTGTEDVLLNGNIVESLAQCFARGGDFSPDAADMAHRLFDITLRDGKLGFDPNGRFLFREGGNRHRGTGEHVVCVLPRIDGERGLPQATIEVSARHTDRTTVRLGAPRPAAVRQL